jgi:hypothetical protein
MLTLVGFARARLKPVPLSIAFEPDMGAGPAREPVRVGADVEAQGPADARAGVRKFPAGRTVAEIRAEDDRLAAERLAALRATADGPRQGLAERVGGITARVAAGLKFTRPVPVEPAPGLGRSLLEKVGEGVARVAAGLKFTRPAPVSFPPIE